MTSALDGLSGQQQAPAALYSQEKNTLIAGGWKRPRARLEGCKTSFSVGFVPVPPSLLSVDITTELPDHVCTYISSYNIYLYGYICAFIHIFRPSFLCLIYIL